MFIHSAEAFLLFWWFIQIVWNWLPLVRTSRIKKQWLKRCSLISTTLNRIGNFSLNGESSPLTSRPWQPLLRNYDTRETTTEAAAWGCCHLVFGKGGVNIIKVGQGFLLSNTSLTSAMGVYLGGYLLFAIMVY